MTSMGVVAFEGQAWGCKAAQDRATGRFFYPLKLTGVSLDSEAARAGLREGDVVVAWKAPDARSFQLASAEECCSWVQGGHYRLEQYVDTETQKMLERGGACQVRVRLAPRCIKHGCPGNIVRWEDKLDHALVCDECGIVQRASLVTNDSEFEGKSRGWTSSACSFTSDAAAACARQETMLAGGKLAKGGLHRAHRAGTGKENARARREERMQRQQAKAREDISRYCDALELPMVAKLEAQHLFDTVANAKNTVLKSGSCIDNYASLIIACIHCASLIVSVPKIVPRILAVADAGAGETPARVLDWVKRVRAAHNRPIPALDPCLLIRGMCARDLGLPISFEETACRSLPIITATINKSPPPSTLAAVAVVFVASMTSGKLDEDMCQRVSEASGVAPSTLRLYVTSALAAGLPFRW